MLYNFEEFANLDAMSYASFHSVIPTLRLYISDLLLPKFFYYVCSALNLKLSNVHASFLSVTVKL